MASSPSSAPASTTHIPNVGKAWQLIMAMQTSPASPAWLQSAVTTFKTERATELERARVTFALFAATAFLAELDGVDDETLAATRLLTAKANAYMQQAKEREVHAKAEAVTGSR